VLHLKFRQLLQWLLMEVLTEQLSALILTAISFGLGIVLQPKSTKLVARNLQHG